MPQVAVERIWYLAYATTEVYLAILVKDTMWHDCSTIYYKSMRLVSEPNAEAVMGPWMLISSRHLDQAYDAR